MAYKSVKPSLTLDDVEQIFSEEIRKYKTICKKNRNNLNCSKHLVNMLKEYASLKLKRQALDENKDLSNLDKIPNIKINII